MSGIDIKSIKKILIIRPGAIGDVLLTTPFIRALKKAMPGAEIDYVAAPFAASVLYGNPNLNSIKLLEKNKGLAATILFYMHLRKQKYDVVIDLFGNTRTALMSFITGAKKRVGFTFRGRKIFYNYKVTPEKKPKYNVYYHMDLLKPLNIDNDGETLDFFTENEDNIYIEEYLKKSGIKENSGIIGLNPAGSWPTKKWPLDKYSMLADKLLENGENEVIVLWGPGEKGNAEEVINKMKNKSNRARVAPETSIKELGALLKRMSLLISNDGGPKHIAVAEGIPTLTLFGPTNYISWNPKGNKKHAYIKSSVDCSPCDKTGCPGRDIECMRNINVEDVYKKALGLLNLR